MLKFDRSVLIIVLFLLFLAGSVNLAQTACAAGLQAKDGWGPVRDEIEKARDSFSAEHELNFLAKASALLRRCDQRAFGDEAAELSDEIRKLEFSALQRSPGSGSAARYEGVVFQLDLLSAEYKLAADIEKNGETVQADEAGEKRASGPFVTHLMDAIRINRARREYYASKTGGVSNAVSRRLILLERASLPFAWAIDRMAAKFNNHAIPVIAGDFVSMSVINDMKTPPAFKNKAKAASVEKVRAVLGRLNKSIKKALKTADFSAVCADSHRALLAVEEIENAERSHFALSKHIVESIGFAALHAQTYAKLSDGETAGLSKLFIRVQALALPLCAGTDAEAQKSHELGAGVLVNDVPLIPFKNEALYERN
ncbi:MAG: hypothetical protein ACD_47C00550G0003, partial [uncultured bacterium]|uniref:Imelysin-like domain-containing protein n=1 Tax=Candidatus Wallbacteria bacterium GWC2_49_35 TaxID=1817813 RepID=A0A1F7WZY8_9BACT